MREILAWLFILVFNPLMSQDSLIWDRPDQLVWEDFKMIPDSSITLHGGGVLAKAGVMATMKLESIESDSEYNCFRLFSVFYPNSSFTMSNDVLLLGHEREHFNLLELHARKFRKKIVNLLNDNCEVDLLEEITTSLNEYIEESSKYDIETIHGTNVLKQIEWFKMIRNGLSELEEYSDNVLLCSCHINHY